MAVKNLREDDENELDEKDKQTLNTQDDEDAEDDEDDSEPQDSDSTSENDVEESADTDENDEERAAIRERRKQERIQKKEHARQRAEQSRRELATLRRERDEMSQRLAILERKSTGAEIAQVDSAIEETYRTALGLKEQIRIATEANDGVAMAEATDRFYQVQRRGEDLLRLKQAAVQNTQTQQRSPLDPSIKRNAEDWMAKNTWYNPQGDDEDSRIALTVDNSMAREGWDPRHPEFWDELDSRLAKYLPHRVGRRPPTSSLNSASEPRQKPRTITGGSGRDSSGGGNLTQFKLSPDRVNAMKEAGIWEDTEKRNAMIEKYRKFDKQAKE